MPGGSRNIPVDWLGPEARDAGFFLSPRAWLQPVLCSSKIHRFFHVPSALCAQDGETEARIIGSTLSWVLVLWGQQDWSFL
jgi:hypothetical protein